MARDFFDQIVYSSANEDGRSELLALRLAPGDVVVAIAGSGARALDLLVSDADQIVAVDFNLHQCRLVALKLAAYQALSHPELLIFLGVADDGDRRELYSRVRPALADPERSYWDERQETVRAGVIYSGAWERFFRLFAAAARPKARALDRLFAAQTLQEQREAWTAWADWRWRLGMRLFGMRWLWRHVLREPGVERVPAELDMSAHMSGLFEGCVQRHLFRDNAYLHLLLRGRYAPDGPLPLHLRPEHHARLQQRAPRVELVHDRLDAWLLREEQRGRLAAFSLSDISSYADDALYARIWQGVLHAAQPGARVCERHFLAPRVPPVPLRREPELEQQLAQQDDTFIYQFVCGTLP